MKIKNLCRALPVFVSGLFLSATAHAQTSGWEKPITAYAENILGGLQSMFTPIGIVVIIVLFLWGFSSKNPGLYKWALGGVAILVLVQVAPGIVGMLTDIRSN